MLDQQLIYASSDKNKPDEQIDILTIEMLYNPYILPWIRIKQK